MDLGWQYLTRDDKRDILRGIRDGRAYGGPYHVEIHPADRCNIDCFFCSTAAIRGTDELPQQRIEELIGELKQAGTRAIRLAGGGEPLFHRRIKHVLRAIAASGIPIENITTNAVILDDETARILTTCCDQITVSLNTFGAESYASMMQTPAKNYERVLKNVRNLIAVRTTKPRVNLQFLVWKENFRDIPNMYALARELGVDTILFSGLAFLKPEQKMTDEEHAEMLRLYEDVIRIDEFRRITNIGSFERDITGDIAALTTRMSTERRGRGVVARARSFFSRDESLRDKVRHHLRMRRNVRADKATADFEEACVIGWYSMLVRSSGTIAPCCILQHKPLGNIFAKSLADVWNGGAFANYRRELTQIIRDRDAWNADGNVTLEPVCGVKGTDLCPMKSFYFARDVEFMRGLNKAFEAIGSDDRALIPQ